MDVNSGLESLNPSLATLIVTMKWETAYEKPSQEQFDRINDQCDLTEPLLKGCLTAIDIPLNGKFSRCPIFSFFCGKSCTAKLQSTKYFQSLTICLFTRFNNRT